MDNTKVKEELDRLINTTNTYLESTKELKKATDNMNQLYDQLITIIKNQNDINRNVLNLYKELSEDYKIFKNEFIFVVDDNNTAIDNIFESSENLTLKYDELMSKIKEDILVVDNNKSLVQKQLDNANEMLNSELIEYMNEMKKEIIQAVIETIRSIR